MIEIQVNLKNRDHRAAVAQALADLKKDSKKAGLFQELRKREHHTPRSVKKREKRLRARIERKKADKKANRNQ